MKELKKKLKIKKRTNEYSNKMSKLGFNNRKPSKSTTQIHGAKVINVVPHINSIISELFFRLAVNRIDRVII